MSHRKHEGYIYYGFYSNMKADIHQKLNSEYNYDKNITNMSQEVAASEWYRLFNCGQIKIHVKKGVVISLLSLKITLNKSTQPVWNVRSQYQNFLNNFKIHVMFCIILELKDQFLNVCVHLLKKMFRQL